MRDIDILHMILGTFTYLRERGLKGIYYYCPDDNIYKTNIKIVPDPNLKFIYDSPIKPRFANDNAP